MNHVYRGVLSMEGLSHRQVFTIANNKLLELGVIDQETHENAQTDMNSAVKRAG